MDRPEAARTIADDHRAIEQQLYRYCRAMDRMDIELGYSIWHEDGEADYGEAIFQGTGRGFVDFVTEAHSQMISHSHQLANPIIELHGDAAVSESYVTAALRFQDGEQLRQMTTRGRYLDQWAFRNGRWAISKRRYIQDFDDVRAVDAIMIPGWSSRDRSDPSYALFAKS